MKHRLGLLLLIATVGCGDDLTRPASGPPDPVRFGALAVGQRSRYLFFDCDRYGEPDQGTQTYAPDTLQLAVVRRDGVRFRVEESLTPGSASRHGAMNVYEPDSTYAYWLKVAGDSLVVVKAAPWPASYGGRLFGGQRLALLLAPIATPETQFAGWQPDIPYHETLVMAFVRNHTQLGQAFDRLNLLQGNTAMQTDGPGFVFAYAGAHGLVRWATYSWWTRSGSGWDLLPP